jgi:hypothetical protein
MVRLSVCTTIGIEPDEFVIVCPASEAVDKATNTVSYVAQQRSTCRELAAALTTSDSIEVEKSADIPPAEGLVISEGLSPLRESLRLFGESVCNSKRESFGADMLNSEIQKILDSWKLLELEPPSRISDVLKRLEEQRHVLGNGSATTDHQLRWAGKPLIATSTKQTMRDYFGPNEKVTIKVNLVKISEPINPGAPRGVDSETYSNMLSYYYKREEELKQLDADTDDSYLQSVWTNPTELKNTLNGIGNIKFRM